MGSVENYPGENSNIPKRLLEALRIQPLTFLIPKDGLSELVTDSLELNYVAERPQLDNLHKCELGEAISDKPDKQIRIKEPVNESLFFANEENKFNLLSTLSDKAKVFLEQTGTPPIAKQVEGPFKNSRKHSFEESFNDPSELDLSYSSDIKRARISTSVSQNLTNIGDDYVNEFNKLVNATAFENDIQNEKKNLNSEVWKLLPSGDAVTTINLIQKIHRCLQNIIELPNCWPNIPADSLEQLLDITSNNIIAMKNVSIRNQEYDNILDIGLISTKVIFLVYIMNSDSKDLLIDRHVLSPINFINELVLDLKSVDDDIPLTLLSMLYEAISPLPDFLSLKSFIDEEIITKFVYVFVDIIFLPFENVHSDLKKVKLLNEIKIIGRSSLQNMFITFPAQRDFIIGEILAKIEELPNKRTTKKSSSNSNDDSISDFTMTLVQFLSSINIFDHCKTIDTWTPEKTDTAIRMHQESSNSIMRYCDMIANTLFDKCKDSNPQNKHLLEIYVSDLSKMYAHPTWPVTEFLLQSITKRLLMVFRSNKSTNINLETTALQNLGIIFGKVFEIKIELDKSNENENSVLKLIENKSDLIKYFNFFDQLLRSSSSNEESIRYWSLNIDFLHSCYTSDIKSNDIKKLIYEKITELFLQTRNSSDWRLKAAVPEKNTYNSILSIGGLYRLYDSYLRILLNLISSEKIKLRSTSIKNLSMLALKDQSILTNVLVKQTIQRRLSDSSTSVKDAILELVSVGSSYINYYEEINANFNDDSPTIRKHVLNLNEKIYNSTNDINLKVYVASRIVFKLEDEEESIVDKATDILFQKWINLEEEMIQDQDNVMIVRKQNLEIISTIFSSEEKLNELISKFFKSYLLNKTIHNSAENARIINSITHIIDTLINEVVLLIGKSSDHEAKALQNYLNLLVEFSEFDVITVRKEHLLTLFPYLFSEQSNELQLFLLFIFRNSIGRLTNFKSSFLRDLEFSIIENISKIGSQELETSIQILWEVGNQTKDYSKLQRMCYLCLTQIRQYVVIANSNPEELRPDGKVQRLIYISSSFAKLANHNNDQNATMFRYQDEKIFEFVAKCLLVFSKIEINPIIRRIAIRNLIGISGKHIQLFNSPLVIKIFDYELRENREEIKLVIYQGLHEFFLDNEKISLQEHLLNTSSKKIETVKSINKDTTKKKRSAADGLCFSLVSKFLAYILNDCLSSNYKLALSCTRLVNIIIKYGFVNPTSCLPVVIGLLLADNEKIKTLSKKTLDIVTENHESLIYPSLTKGIEAAMMYAERTYSENFVEQYLFLYDLQQNFIPGKKSNIKFLQHMAKILTNYTRIVTTKGCTIKELNQIGFFCINMAQINFQNHYELYILMRELDAISENLKDFILNQIQYKKSPKFKESHITNLIIIQTLIQELVSHILNKYGIKSDILYYDGNFEQELKSKALPFLKKPNTSFLEKFEETKRFWEGKPIFRYLYSLDNGDD